MGQEVALTGATGNVPATATASAANFEVSGGAMLSLPQLASYTQPVGCCYTGTLEATGAGSLLSLTGLTSIADTSSGSTLVEALQGGDVELPALTTSTGNVTYQTDSSTSNTIDLPLLASLTNGTLNDAGGTVTVPVLTTASGANFYVSNGLTLNLPELTSYTQPNGCCYTGTLEATGTGSVLSMPELTSIANTSSGSTLVEALSGGKVELPALNQVTGSNVTLESSGSGSALTGATGNAPATATASAANFEVSGGATLSLPQLASYTQPVGCCYTGTLEATGAGSLLSLTGLTSIADTSSGSTLVEALQGGDVELPALTTSTGNVTYQTDSSTSNTIDLPLLASLTNGTLNDAGGTVTVPVLTTASGANFYVSNGLTLNLPELTSYTQPNGCCYTGTLEATGTGSVLSMPELTSIANTSSGSTLVEALSGGKVELPALNQVTGSNVTLESSGSGSALTGATGNCARDGHRQRSQLRSQRRGDAQPPSGWPATPSLLAAVIPGHLRLQGPGACSRSLA